MALQEYKRKRRFDATPEPPPKLQTSRDEHRFVVQKHRASHLHYDFRLEMDGVLKSWAVPKGPSLDPSDKRLAMMVEDHPVSYFDFEGVIPPGNYGAGTVMVWDTGTWEPLGDPSEMLRKGDLKFRLRGKKLNGEFALVHMRSRRTGSKGNEWLLIKKRDQYAQQGFDANDEALDYSGLTRRSLEEIAGDRKSAAWQSNRKAATKRGQKTDWLAESIADVEKVNQKKARAKDTKPVLVGQPSSHKKEKAVTGSARNADPQPTKAAPYKSKKTKGRQSDEDEPAVSSISSRIRQTAGAIKTAMPHVVHPMLATLVDEPFDDDDWIFEIKWDGYRALAYIEEGKVSLVSRNQNEFESYPELRDIPEYVRAETAILDGEIVALDEQGRPSFSLMQQRLGVLPGGGRRRRTGPAENTPVVYYAFDLLYLEGYSLFRATLEDRKRLLRELLADSGIIRYSDHFAAKGIELYKVAAERGLEGIIGKRRDSQYIQKRSREWLKIKITQTQECIVGGYTEPKGARQHFGSLILGLYDDRHRLIPVGQAGSGFNQKSHAEMWQRLKKLETPHSPFFGKPESNRRVHFVKPELVAQIEFGEWTHEGQSGQIKMRTPIFQGLRVDKKPEECVFEKPRPANDMRKAS
ncbi:MAG: ATP-dependent DNA ligase [Acidobacteria bacterium]|nr:MAG: ATP-dependent DNA ligase [Acidobacteriota bacterium]